MSPQEAEAWRKSKSIVCMGTNIPKPVRTFEEGSFPDYILSVVEKEYGLQASPTPVQSQVWLRCHVQLFCQEACSAQSAILVVVSFQSSFSCGCPYLCFLQAWPVALSGRDCVNVAETGSGKTLAFMLPAIVHINAQPYLQVKGDRYQTACLQTACFSSHSAWHISTLTAIIRSLWCSCRQGLAVFCNCLRVDETTALPTCELFNNPLLSSSSGS